MFFQLINKQIQTFLKDFDQFNIQIRSTQRDVIVKRIDQELLEKLDKYQIGSLMSQHIGNYVQAKVNELQIVDQIPQEISDMQIQIDGYPLPDYKFNDDEIDIVRKNDILLEDQFDIDKLILLLNETNPQIQKHVQKINEIDFSEDEMTKNIDVLFICYMKIVIVQQFYINVIDQLNKIYS